MKKKLLEISFDKEFSESSVVVFHNGHWVAMSKDVYLNNVYKSMRDLLDNLQSEVAARELENQRLNDKISKMQKQINYILGEEDDEEEN